MSKRRFVVAVDDDESIRELYASQLEVIGCEVRTASTGDEARAILKKRTPDAILMDVMMSDEDGISLTREFRADPKTSGVPILVVSGLRDAAVLSDAMLAGATDYITKPFDLDTLRGKLERVFELMKRRKG